MIEDLERCPFCGLEVEIPCDSPPPVICQTAHEKLLAERPITSAATPAGAHAPAEGDQPV